MRPKSVRKKITKLTPAVNKGVLPFLAGGVWLGGGFMLVELAYSWLQAALPGGFFLFGTIGVAAAVVIHYFGFSKLVDKNLHRLLPLDGKQCIFAFIPWKSYLLIAVMIALGALLRHSRIPKPYLATLYIGIGLALMLSSLRYLRVFFVHLKQKS